MGGDSLRTKGEEKHGYSELESRLNTRRQNIALASEDGGQPQEQQHSPVRKTAEGADRLTQQGRSLQAATCLQELVAEAWAGRALTPKETEGNMDS